MSFTFIVIISIIVIFVASISTAVLLYKKRKQKTKDVPLHICYPGCIKLRDLLYTSMSSIIQQNKKVNFYIFNNNEYDDVSVNLLNEDLQKHNDIYKCEYTITIIDISPWISIFEDLKTLHSSLNCYARLLIPRVFQLYFPNVKRVIYLDEDTLCLGSLQKLYRYKFSKDFAACIDWNKYLSKKDMTNKDITNKWLSKNDYICSGILLIKTNFDILNKRFIKVINLYKIISLYNLPVKTHDQFILNMYKTDIISDLRENVNKDDTKTENDIYAILSNHYLKEFNIIHDWKYKLNDFVSLRTIGVDI